MSSISERTPAAIAFSASSSEYFTTFSSSFFTSSAVLSAILSFLLEGEYILSLLNGSRGFALSRLNQLDQIAHAPQPVRDARGHRRGATRRLVNADEVVVKHEERDGVAVVLVLLAEGVREPGSGAFPSSCSSSRAPRRTC